MSKQTNQQKYKPTYKIYINLKLTATVHSIEDVLCILGDRATNDLYSVSSPTNDDISMFATS